MATCKECVHNNICNIKQKYNHPKYALQHIEKYCEHFKDRSRFIELPCNKINTTVESNIYDEEEVYYDCTVQVLRNSITGETSVGWFRNDEPPVLIGDD